MNKLGLLSRYINYRISSVTKYKIHSPFLYDFIVNVIEDKGHYDDYDKIKKLRKELINDSRTTEFIDFGTGAKVYPYSTYIRRISEIAKKTEQKFKYASLLYRISRYFNPSKIIELGTSLGMSSMNLALGNPEAKITTIEGCSNIASLAKENFEKLELKNIDIIIGNFDNVLPKLCQTTETSDLVFFDGNHRRNKTIEYFKLCLPLVNNNTIFVFDDIHWSKGMEEAWEYIKSDEKVKLTLDMFQMGIVFFRKELSKEDYILRY